ncbi:MAG: MAPEG family protein [Pseudohongiellaceae bacterium]
MLYPMFMMVMLTYVVMLITVRVRTSAVNRGDIQPSYFSIFQGENIPEMVHKTNRHFDNLFEMPVLFYLAGVLYIALDLSDPFPIACAWAFVVLRVIHTCIHLGYNNVMHRLIAFILGTVCVLAMWISIVIAAG